MIQLKNITLRNFLSIGAVTQAVNFDSKELTLILGENLDLGGDGARNGTGKTTLIQGLSYVLFGTPINNIRKDNLINRTNAKGMMVTLEFQCNGVDYKIERGRKPNILKFYVDNKEEECVNDAQGENKETQEHIERAIGMTPDMFKQIIALNTYSEPFLAMKTNEQRNIIEQLLGITLLSEKAELIKDQIKQTKDKITEEEYKNKAIEEANKRILEQIENLKRRAKLWDVKHSDDLKKLTDDLDELKKLDIDAELQGHKDLTAYNQRKKDHADIDKAIAREEADVEREEKALKKAKKELATIEEHKCHTCGQEIHDDQHKKLQKEKEKFVKETEKNIETLNISLATYHKAKQELGTIGKQPVLYYDTEQEAFQHRSLVDSLISKIDEKSKEENPYTDQISEMENQALQIVDFNSINAYTKLLEHQKFLLDLLTNKDSFVRKKIIDQNLSYLNARLTHYLDRIGLPHQVIFLNDLSVEITEYGRELDFDNLSRGERNRLILGLSFAFRDVWESLYSPINTLFIDELIDSGMDSIGVENSMAILKDMSRNRNKSVWLVSHREELAGRVPSVLKVVKENGFTTYNTTHDLVL
jgi:DNA repair exonuclease SbcCD ATPase subunit